MYSNQSDSKLLVSQGQLLEVESLTGTRTISTGQAAIYLDNNTILNPNGNKQLPNRIKDYNSTRTMSVEVLKYDGLPYVKKIFYNEDDTFESGYFIWLNGLASEYSNIRKILVNNSKINPSSYVVVGDDILVKCKRSLVRESNTVAIFKINAGDVQSYGIVYETDNCTDEELLSKPYVEVFDFIITENNTVEKTEGSFNKVSDNEIIEQNHTISFTEYEAESSIYPTLISNAGNTKYAIVRIVETDNSPAIEIYHDCILTQHNKSDGTDVNRYTYEFTCKKVR